MNADQLQLRRMIFMNGGRKTVNDLAEVLRCLAVDIRVSNDGRLCPWTENSGVGPEELETVAENLEKDLF